MSGRQLFWLFLVTLAVLASANQPNYPQQPPHGGYPYPPQEQQPYPGAPVGTQPRPTGPPRPPGQYPPSTPGFGSPPGYGPPPSQQQQQQQGGIFAKLKGFASSAANALTQNSNEGNPNIPPSPPGMGRSGPQLYSQSPPQGFPGQSPSMPPIPRSAPPPHQMGPPPPGMGGGNIGSFGRGPQGHPAPPQQTEPGPGFFGKLKSLFQDKEADGYTDGYPPQRSPSYPTNPFQQPPRPFEGQPSAPPGYSPRPEPPFPPNPFDGYGQIQGQEDGSGMGGSAGMMPPHGAPDAELHDNYHMLPQQSASLPPPPQQQQQMQQQHMAPPRQYDEYSQGSYPQPPPEYYQPPPQYGEHPAYPPQQPPAPVDPLAGISPEPQALVVENSIVLILKPREFYRKKHLFAAAGSGALQFYSDFERVLTSNKASDGSRCLGTAELLETSPALLPQAVQAIKAVGVEFDSVDMNDAAFEEYSRRCQQVIAAQAGLHMASVAPATRDMLATGRLTLRDGWQGTLHSLTSKGVPTFIFSSGYGDIVLQCLVQSGCVDASHSTVVPQNIRVISNFFKAAPDGTVRAFTSPIVHERNKNATTASRIMGFPVPEREHALVLGSHEDDVLMTEGAPGIKEQINVGFLELADDLASRLPAFLNAYDVVVLGEGSLGYVRALVDDVLGVAVEQKKGGLRERLGFLKNIGEGLAGGGGDLWP